MHESGLTEDLFAHVMQHAQEANASRVLRIRVRIGALSDAVPESIQFYFDSLAPGTIAEGALLEFSTVPGQAHCQACGADAAVDAVLATCPMCGAFPVHITSGNAVYLDSVEVETQMIDKG